MMIVSVFYEWNTQNLLSYRLNWWLSCWKSSSDERYKRSSTVTASSRGSELRETYCSKIVRDSDLDSDSDSLLISLCHLMTFRLSYFLDLFMTETIEKLWRTEDKWLLDEMQTIKLKTQVLKKKLQQLHSKYRNHWSIYLKHCIYRILKAND